MEAVMESLKDLEMRNPEAGELPVVTSASVEPSRKTDQQDASPTESCAPLKTESTSTSVRPFEPLKTESSSTSVRPYETLKTESTSTSIANAQKLASEHPSPDALDALSGMETGSTGTSARSDTSASIQSSSDADMSATTKATLTVERNPASHIMDSLMRRWDLNFFRNSHNR